MKPWAKLVLALSICMLILSGCSSSSMFKLKSKNYGIKLVPLGTSGELKVDSASNGCKANVHNGCMFFPENTVGLIKFFLPQGRNSAKTCADGVRNVITKIQLTASGNASKGDYTVFPLPDWVKDEAFSSVDLNTGIVYSKPVGEAANQVWLLNANANDPKNGDKTFWYRVTATDCTNPANTWVTDPRGRNGGTRR